MRDFDAIVIGAGAAGMMCAGVAGQRGVRVALLEHGAEPGEKIRISGGGRCNFTNRSVDARNFVSANPDFCRSALAGYGAQDFVALVRRHGIRFHEKHRGQLFCDGSAIQIIDMLRAECAAGGVELRLGARVGAVHSGVDGFTLEATGETLRSKALVIATGGLSIPKIGATDLAYRLARQFGLRVVEPRPGLVPLVFQASDWAIMTDLSGVSVPVEISCRGPYGPGRFREDLLFTHRGLSGPAALQVSSYWSPGSPVTINLMPGVDWPAQVRAKGRRKSALEGMLADWLPRRLAEKIAGSALPSALRARAVAELPDKVLLALAGHTTDWQVCPSGTEGFRKAEVTLGGVDTRDLSSRTMQARQVPGLYFIGEAVDVTGWLGGYNFQWAWSSAVACARSLAAGR
ncbi:MAG: NAD(P)/FAD-dependent oxidoreductase [Burkholderiales bacterium]|nr:NAD(P)/FAD-dependent oxidoreductase [Burkholderiales bacterium]